MHFNWIVRSAWLMVVFLLFGCSVDRASAARRCEAPGSACSWRPEVGQRACCSGVCDVPLGKENGKCTWNAAFLSPAVPRIISWIPMSSRRMHGQIKLPFFDFAIVHELSRTEKRSFFSEIFSACNWLWALLLRLGDYINPEKTFKQWLFSRHIFGRQQSFSRTL